MYVLIVSQFIYIFNYRFKYILETIILMPKRQKMAIQKLYEITCIDKFV